MKTEPEKPLDWSLRDSGVYDPDSYFPLRIGAYWIYEASDGKRDSMRCTNNYTDFRYTSPVDTGLCLWRFNTETGKQYSNSASYGHGIFEGYRILFESPCGNGIFLMDTSLQYNEFIYPKSCYYFHSPGHSPQQQFWQEHWTICISSDSSVDGYDNVKVYLRANYAVKITDEVTPLTTNEYNVRKVISIDYSDYKSEHEINFYAKGVGRIKTIFCKNGMPYKEEKLVRYHIQ